MNPTATPLIKLRKDDLLVLYAGFQEINRPWKKLIGIMAYIVIRCAYVIDHKRQVAWISPTQLKALRSRRI